MEIIRTVADMKARAAAWKAEGLSIGLVPTMGSLHEGHESLMDAARAASDRVVVSVFVNPIQFGPGEDYEAYPRDLERDARICERHGVDVVFHPEVDDMYAPAHNTFVVMETLTDSLCGASRPGTSAACARWSRSSSTSCSRIALFSGRRTPSSSPSSSAWWPT